MEGTGAKTAKKVNKLSKENIVKAFTLMCTAKTLAEKYEANKEVTAKYVHATSRGHEAIQIAVGMQLKPQDWVAPYYRDDSILLSIGMKPSELMLQVFAKKDDPFSGGRTYYSHPSLKRDDMPKIPHQSSATGMQAIPTTGVAMGIQYKEKQGLSEDYQGENPVVVCSLGDASCTEGEVSEALQMAALKQYPIVYLVQDNGWDISANAAETRSQDISFYAQGFNGIEVRTIDGSDFQLSYETVQEVFDIVRKERRPFIIHAKVPLLGHHTSGVRKEWYRDDLEEAASRDPYPKLKDLLRENGIGEADIINIEADTRKLVDAEYEIAFNAEDPDPTSVTDFIFAPTPITEEKGEREPKGKKKTVMVDSALFAVRELMAKHPEALLYGQDVGGRLGGVFREAATLAQTFGDDRVFNTPIQEAFIIGSTVGMSAVGLKPFVEVQFADYIWPGLNQLFTEVSRSYYLSNGKWPVSCVIRVPIGAYGSGGPYHSSSVESVLTNIRGIKIAYPSNGADLKGLMKAAFYDPNPVVMLEHKGLYWSKIPGTEGAMSIEPDEDYIIPFGKARVVQEANEEAINKGDSCVIITYGRGVYWALEASKEFDGRVEIVDLRTLNPLDHEKINDVARKHGKVMLVTEESVEASFTLGLAGRIQRDNFKFLDAPVSIVGSIDTPAIPLNSILEAELLTNATKVKNGLSDLLSF
ncbi:MAG: thiamine pyrophosphate-dependent enzyme [Crocinitomicaceae bacterium]|jgi:2-oxoisovalerate dehydrogenase E1 component|nr:thiamine pyrophosphate-dependent enzyme [Crocinitomicaceae bacterium]MDP4865153.1 thiamine pyrophosphate-dependent enzyme [Crocinitomicaceae bacterium]MDP5010433.1 thiamine pyrophosphate-dependent enzyme [Crocinitomicaceae bacterium]MDP5099047.1 thiamine pyrophosphate-dependent enzyme [Crocinitomicaceae bacterium]